MARSADRLLRSTAAAAATPGRWLDGRGALWRGSVRDGAAFWLATQAALVVFTWVAVIAVTNVYNHGPTAVRSRLFLESWARWDGAFYLQIAQAGYTQAPQTPFFPFYPLLARGLGTLF